MESAMCSDTTMEFSGSTEPFIESFSEESLTFLRSLTLRKVILSKLCEEVRNGRISAVNSLFAPYEFSVNPDFLKSLSGKLRIMRDIEIALHELGDEDLLSEFIATETQLFAEN